MLCDPQKCNQIYLVANHKKVPAKDPVFEKAVEYSKLDTWLHFLISPKQECRWIKYVLVCMCSGLYNLCMYCKYFTAYCLYDFVAAHTGWGWQL